MAKYNFKFKLQIVQAYINSEGSYRILAKKFTFTNIGQLRKWINAYKAFITEGLIRKRINNNTLLNLKYLW